MNGETQDARELTQRGRYEYVTRWDSRLSREEAPVRRARDDVKALLLSLENRME